MQLLELQLLARAVLQNPSLLYFLGCQAIDVVGREWARPL